MPKARLDGAITLSVAASDSCGLPRADGNLRGAQNVARYANSPARIRVPPFFRKPLKQARACEPGVKVKILVVTGNQGRALEVDWETKARIWWLLGTRVGRLRFTGKLRQGFGGYWEPASVRLRLLGTEAKDLAVTGNQHKAPSALGVTRN